MARPENADSAATHDQIVAAARARIREQGVDRFSMRSVAAAADVSLGTITYYFETRQGLIEACLEDGYRWVGARAKESLAKILGGAPLEGEVEHLTRQLFRRAVEDRELIRARILDTMQRGELGERLERDLVPMLDVVAAALGSPESAGRLRLVVHSFELLVARYAIHTEEEHRKITGEDDLDDALARVEDHLAGLSRTLFRDAVRGTAFDPG